MGLGLLFIGYFTTYLASFNSFGFLMRLIGYVIMLVAFNKLRKYNRTFLLPLVASAVMICGAVFESFLNIEVLSYNDFTLLDFVNATRLLNIYLHIDSVLIFVFHALLLWSIRKISIETESEKTAYAAVRNFVFLAFYYLMTYIALLPFDFIEQYERYFSLPVFLVYIVCLVLNCILIFSCYAKICDENDVDMQIKKSRFAFVNRIREKADQKEQAAADANAEYIKKTLKEKRNKKK